MSLVVRRVTLAGTTAVVLIGIAAPSYAETQSQCEQQATDVGDTCIEDNGQWSLVQGSGDDGFGPDSGGSGIPGGFVFLFVLVALIGVATTIWKVTTARRLATGAGLDPGVATGMTLLSDDGLGATYLAASLRGSQTHEQAPTPTPAPTSVSDRLSELKRLLDSGAITQAEHDERRAAIINSV
jgi:hypothetical protein